MSFIGSERLMIFCEIFAALPTRVQCWFEIFLLKRQHSLSVYDHIMFIDKEQSVLIQTVMDVLKLHCI